MRKVGDLFRDLGFNENASDDVKIAFIKNLVKAAYGTEVRASDLVELKDTGRKSGPKIKEEQLAFDFDVSDDLKKAN